MPLLVLRSLTWLLPGLALLAFWRAAAWAYAFYGCSGHSKAFDTACYAGPINVGWVASVGWLCMLLWFPIFLAGVVKAGLSIQRRLLEEGISVPQFTYAQALRLSPVACLIWLAVTGVGTCAALVAMYPAQPSSIGGWLLILFPWLPLWLALSWLRNRTSPRKTHA